MGMSNFEVGDKVRLTRLDTTNHLYVSRMNGCLGQIGTVRGNTISGNVDVTFDGIYTFCYPANWFVLVKKHETYWNGQFVVVGECQTKSLLHPKMQPVTIGKVYELKDGKVTLDDLSIIQNYHYKSFDDFAARLREFGVRIIEFKGFCRNEGKGKNE